MIFIKRPPTRGTGKTVSKQQHTRSYKLHLGKFWPDWDANNRKPLTRPCYESAPLWLNIWLSCLAQIHQLMIRTVFQQQQQQQQNNKENRGELVACCQTTSQPRNIYKCYLKDYKSYNQCSKNQLRVSWSSFLCTWQFYKLLWSGCTSKFKNWSTLVPVLCPAI